MQDKLMDDSAFVRKHKDTWIRTSSYSYANDPIRKEYVKCHADSIHVMTIMGFVCPDPRPSYKILIRYYILPIKDDVIAHWRHLIQFASGKLDGKDIILSIDYCTELHDENPYMYKYIDYYDGGILTEYQKASIDKVFVPKFNETFRDIIKFDIKSIWSMHEDPTMHKD